MLLSFGSFLLTVSVLALAWNLRISYVTRGGAAGQVPVLAAACIQVPLLLMLGLWFIDHGSMGFDLDWWLYPLLWVGLVLAIGWFTMKRGQIGKSRRSDDS